MFVRLSAFRTSKLHYMFTQHGGWIRACMPQSECSPILKLPSSVASYGVRGCRYGSVTHSGFGLGLERLIMLVTGISNIRDTIPYPRYPGHADF